MKTKHAFIAAAVAALLFAPFMATDVSAIAYKWTQSTTGTWDWNDAGNWDANGVPAEPGAAGDTLYTRNDSAIVTIDLKGDNVNCPNLSTDVAAAQDGFGFKQLTLDDSIGGATFTIDTMRIGFGYNIGLGPHNINVPMIADNLISASNPGVYFNDPVTVSDTFRFQYLDNTVDGKPNVTHIGCSVYFEVAGSNVNQLRGDDLSGKTNTYVDAATTFGSVYLGTGPYGSSTFTANDTATIGTLNLNGGKFVANAVPAVTTWNITDGSWIASIDGGMPQGSMPINDGDVVNITATQSGGWGSADLTVKAGGMLIGDMTGADYSASGNVSFEENAILGATAGLEPERADLGDAAILVQGVTDVSSNATVWEVGEDGIPAGSGGTAIYKGLLFTPLLTGQNNIKGTFKAVPGSGNLKIQVNDYAWGKGLDNGAQFIGDGVTNAVDIDSRESNWNLSGPFNGTCTDPNKATVFNYTGINAPGIENMVKLNNFRVDADQTVTFSYGAIRDANNLRSAGDLRGRLILGKHSQMQWGGNSHVFSSGDANDIGTLEIQDRGSIRFNHSSMTDSGFLEGLAYVGTDPTPKLLDEDRLEFSGTPVMDMNWGTYTLDWANNPVLEDLWTHSDIMIYANNKTYTFNGDPLKIGQDCVLFKPSQNSKITGTSVITSALNNAPGETPRFILAYDYANDTRNVLYIQNDVSAPAAVMQIGGAPREFFVSRAWNTFNLTGTVRLDGTVDVGAIDIVYNSTCRIDVDVTVPDVMIEAGSKFQIQNAATTAAITGTLSGAGQFAGNGLVALSGTVAPGESVGTLTGEADLQMINGAILAIEINSDDNTGGLNSDTLVLNGQLILDGSIVIDLVKTDDFAGVEGDINTVILSCSNINNGTNPVDITTLVSFDSSDSSFGVGGASLVDNGNDTYSITGLTAGFDPDINGDDEVDGEDLQLVLSGFGSIYNQENLDAVLEAYGQPSAGGAEVPEPASALMLLLGAFGLLGLRRRR